MNKNLIAAVVLVLVVGGTVWYNKYNTFDPSVDTKTFKTAGEFENYYKNLNELYKKDTYGGITPEETLALFIDALKKGDTDLAAKYFVPEKQKNEAEELLAGKKNNVLSLLINDLEKEKIGSNFSEGRYRFITHDNNNNAEFQFDLVLNPSTKVWKIESL